MAAITVDIIIWVNGFLYLKMRILAFFTQITLVYSHCHSGEEKQQIKSSQINRGYIKTHSYNITSPMYIGVSKRREKWVFCEHNRYLFLLEKWRSKYFFNWIWKFERDLLQRGMCTQRLKILNLTLTLEDSGQKVYPFIPFRSILRINKMSEYL